MTLLAVLLALSIEKLAPSMLRFRRYDWINSFQSWVRNSSKQIEKWNDTYSLAVVILVPILITAGIHYELFRLGALFGFIFSVLVLAYTLGPNGIFQFIQHAEELSQHQDPAQLRAIATDLLKEALPDKEEDICRLVKQELLIRNNVAITAILFWFAILGPMGAILYRITHILLQSEKMQDNAEYKQAVDILFALLNWLPLHLTALSYAITGSFMDALHHWRENRIENNISAHLNNDSQENLLVAVGLGALQIAGKTDSDTLPGVISVIALAKRSVILWLTVLAILTMAGWAG